MSDQNSHAMPDAMTDRRTAHKYTQYTYTPHKPSMQLGARATLCQSRQRLGHLVWPRARRRRCAAAATRTTRMPVAPWISPPQFVLPPSAREQAPSCTMMVWQSRHTRDFAGTPPLPSPWQRTLASYGHPLPAEPKITPGSAERSRLDVVV
jgi:hypothetical protein